MSVKEAMSWTTWFLSTRSSTTGKVSEKLQRKGFDPSTIEAVIAQCLEKKYLDDAAYADSVVNSRLRSGRKVGRILEAELRHKGISADVARRVTVEASAESNLVGILVQYLSRKYSETTLAALATDQKLRAKIFRHLLSRGYAYQTICEALANR